eukprot:scaffold3772_cov390-Prasinococcus_capsulatus_cf.AAC.3
MDGRAPPSSMLRRPPSCARRRRGTGGARGGAAPRARRGPCRRACGPARGRRGRGRSGPVTVAAVAYGWTGSRSRL